MTEIRRYSTVLQHSIPDEDYAVTRRTMLIAGWLTMISAFVSIPMAWLAFRLEGQTDPAAALLIVIMQAAGTVLFVVITLLLRRFLKSSRLLTLCTG